MILKILILAVIQGIAELLPVSSSAHVIVAEKLMHLDPTSPPMTLLLVMLHTGTMFAVIVFFWNSWKERFFSSKEATIQSFQFIIAATVLTGIIGVALKVLIEKVFLKDYAHAEIELLFGNLGLIAAALATAGILILWAGFKGTVGRGEPLNLMASCLIGAVQGICLPFRGFSRSGATISIGLLIGVEKKVVEDFSFALAVILTPPVILKEVLRLLKTQHAPAHTHAIAAHGASIFSLFVPSLIGMVFSFFAGLLALKWLSSWLESGRWYLFGYYCLCAAVIVFFLFSLGY
jgi:undecaprenyl-diphosphatase